MTTDQYRKQPPVSAEDNRKMLSARVMERHQIDLTPLPNENEPHIRGARVQREMLPDWFAD